MEQVVYGDILWLIDFSMDLLNKLTPIIYEDVVS